MKTSNFHCRCITVWTAATADWVGPYAGGMIGYDFGSGYSTVSGAPLDVNGAQIGAFGGINFQTDNFVYGFEVNASKDSARWREHT